MPETPGRKIGLRSFNAGVNPKDRIGASKVDMTLLPGTALTEVCLALMDGASKYGPYNWRIEPVQFRTYLSAAIRHLEKCLDGEMFDRDTHLGVPTMHLGNVMACCAILIDAYYQNTLTDDRPVTANGLSKTCSNVMALRNAQLRRRARVLAKQGS